MKKNTKNENIRLKLVSNTENWIDTFRQNVGILRTHYGWSVRVLAEKADVSENTLDTFLRGRTKECNTSLAVKLAKAFNVSIDELIGAGTIEPEVLECIAMSSELNDHNRYVIRSFVRHQYNTHGNKEGIEKEISVFLPECRNGHLLTTNIYKPLVIDNLDTGTRSRVCMGLQVPCHHYEPYFMKNEILLLGSDRDGFNNEKCVVSHNGNYYICIKKITTTADGKKDIKYVSLMDGHNTLFTPGTIDDKIGYVVGFLEPDNPNDENTSYSWGKR